MSFTIKPIDLISDINLLTIDLVNDDAIKCIIGSMNVKLAKDEKELELARSTYMKTSTDSQGKYFDCLTKIMNQIEKDVFPKIEKWRSLNDISKIFDKYSEIHGFYKKELAELKITANADTELDVFFKTVVKPDEGSDIERFKYIVEALAPKGKFQSVDDAVNQGSVMKFATYYWDRYRRKQFELEGGKCIDLIMTYLIDPSESNLAALSEVGLSPQKVEEELLIADYVLFKEIPQKTKEKYSSKQQVIIDNLMKFYPKIDRKLDEDVIENQKKVSTSKSDQYYKKTLETLTSRVIGQDRASEKLTSTLDSQQTLNSNKVYLFVGPSGVGKTEMGKAVASLKNNRFIFISMIEYMDQMDVTKFSNSSTGYKGSDDKPAFAKHLDKYAVKIFDGNDTENYEVNNVVILFDEFEKAYPTVKQYFLKIFDESLYSSVYSKTDSKNKSSNCTINYSFKKCVLISTSNLYQTEILKAFQSECSVDEIETLFKNLNSSKPIPNSYSPELLKRNTIVPFGPIPRDVYQKLIKKKLDAYFSELKTELSIESITLENENSILSKLEKKLYGDGTDIRNLMRYFANIKELIDKNKGNWKGFKKLKFSSSQNGILIEPGYFNEWKKTYIWKSNDAITLSL